MTALRQAMSRSLQAQMDEVERLRAYFRQPLATGEFDYEKYKVKEAAEKGQVPEPALSEADKDAEAKLGALKGAVVKKHEQTQSTQAQKQTGTWKK